MQRWCLTCHCVHTLTPRENRQDRVRKKFKNLRNNTIFNKHPVPRVYFIMKSIVSSLCDGQVKKRKSEGQRGKRSGEMVRCFQGENELLHIYFKYMYIQGVQEKLCFFIIHCNPSLAYNAVRDSQSYQRRASVQSLLLSDNFLYNQ